jgi:hypothetical protein
LALLGTLLAFAYLVSASRALLRGEGTIISAVDLVIHEAGHTLFAIFGQFIGILMGSGLQILVPLVFAAYFGLRREFVSAAIMCMWTGESLVNVGIYAGDGEAMRLPLIADGLIHDWNWLLSRFGVVDRAEAVGMVIRLGGWMSLIVGLTIGLYGTAKHLNPSLGFHRMRG